MMKAVSTSRALRLALLRWEWQKVKPVIALRNTCGVVLALAVFIAIHQTSLGLVAGLGALNVAYSDGDDPYALRGRRMLLSSAIGAVSLFAGGVTGGIHALGIPFSAVWAFATGLLVALGSTAADLGSISLVTVLVFAARPLTPQQAALSGLVALSGGLLQTGLSLLFWPVRPYVHERAALGALYRELSGLIAASVVIGAEPPGTGAFISAQQTLSALNLQHDAESERLSAILSQAERIRLAVLTLARLRPELDPNQLNSRLEGAQLADAPLRQLSQFLETCAELLRAIAQSVVTMQVPPGTQDGLRDLSRMVEHFRTSEWPDSSAFHSALVRATARQMEALAGQIRSALRLATQSREQSLPPSAGADTPSRDWNRGLQARLAILRANLILRSVAFRHALRLSVCVGIATAVGYAVDWQRSYWIPMTAAIVLRPDFLTTFSRGALRLAGTLLGLTLATLIYAALPQAAMTDLIVVGVFTLLLRSVGAANYGVFTVAISALVVALISGTGTDPKQVILLRGLNTAIGGTIGMLSYAVWPTWERTQWKEIFALLLEEYRAYLQAVGRTLFTRDSAALTHVDQTRQAARVARSNAEASADRLELEPAADKRLQSRVAAMLAVSHDFVFAAMALESSIVPDTTRSSMLRGFLQQVDLTLYYLVACLRGTKINATDLPDLREQYRQIAGARDSEPEPLTLLEVEIDRMTNALNTLAEQIGEVTGNDLVRHRAHMQK